MLRFLKNVISFHLCVCRVTNSDGRCPGLLTSQTFIPGIYKIKFATAKYWQSLEIASFYPYIEVITVKSAVLKKKILLFSSIEITQFKMKSEIYHARFTWEDNDL